ncbi:hypothetical protein [Cohaesibacter celericrescens]|uniref:hypothetical protein n=1 Tax=Cohaesibacter celericrescens TaxID=2067669 RepID=UPI003561A52D
MSDISETTQEIDKTEQDHLEAERMIGWDFVFSIIVMVFSIFVIANSLTMPFSGTVGGVTTTWYESPGLLPLFIGCSLFVAGLSVFLKSAREGGRKLFRTHAADISPIPFLLSGGGILGYIFVLISWFDFFLASFVFLLFYISLYYIDDAQLSKKLITIYYASLLIFAAIFLTGTDQAINAGYEYTTDILLILCAAIIIGTLFGAAKGAQKKIAAQVRTVIIVALLFPTVLVPTFRYFLLVPMPKEGLVVERIFNTTYFNYLAPAKEVEDDTLSDSQMQDLDNAF